MHGAQGGEVPPLRRAWARAQARDLDRGSEVSEAGPSRYRRGEDEGLFPERPDGGTDLVFEHRGLHPALECYTICENRWDRYLAVSLNSTSRWEWGSPLMRRSARCGRKASGGAQTEPDCRSGGRMGRNTWLSARLRSAPPRAQALHGGTQAGLHPGQRFCEHPDLIPAADLDPGV